MTPSPKQFSSNELPAILDNFVATANKAKVAVIVPLFGYWGDAPSQQLNAEVLSVFLNRIYSRNHDLFIYMVGETDRIPKPIANLIVAKAQAGNYQGIHMEKGSSYADYVRKGMQVALEESKASFMVIANPWVLLQHGGIDALIERTNINDEAKIICGYDVNKVIQPEGFETYVQPYPKEERALTFDLCAMTRSSAESFALDPQFVTHQFIERDAWQTAFSKGYESVVSTRIPIFSFDVDWTELESEENFLLDQAAFVTKWRYDPGIKYGKSA